LISRLPKSPSRPVTTSDVIRRARCDSGQINSLPGSIQGGFWASRWLRHAHVFGNGALAIRGATSIRRYVLYAAGQFRLFPAGDKLETKPYHLPNSTATTPPTVMHRPIPAKQDAPLPWKLPTRTRTTPTTKQIAPTSLPQCTLEFSRCFSMVPTFRMDHNFHFHFSPAWQYTPEGLCVQCPET